MNMTLKQAIDYLQPIADSTPLAGYGAALAAALDAMRAQEARQNPKTNADMIRSMSDEELAVFLGEDFGKVGMDRVLAWLQQPAEEVKSDGRE